MEVKISLNKKKDSLFFRAYHRVNSIIPDKRIVLGDSIKKICRFCGKGSNETKFKMKAHVMPEFMGNKYCFSNFECDSCNSYFGELEDSLSNFAGILNTLSTVKGKKGYSKFKDNTEKYELFADDFRKIIMRDEDPEKNESFVIDEKSNRMNINVMQPGYIPQDVYKSLVKIALCMMNESDIRDYQRTLDWLKEPNMKDEEFDFMFHVFRKVGGEKMFPHPMAFLYRKLNNPSLRNFPSHTFVIYYGIIQYQIFIPYCQNDFHLKSAETVHFPIENFLITEVIKGNVTEYGIDRIYLGGIDKVKSERIKFSTGFKLEEKKTATNSR